EYSVCLGIGATDSLGGKLLRQSLVGRIFLLLRGPGSCPVGIVSSHGAAWALVHPDQSVPRQSLLAAMGGQSERSGACALRGGVCRAPEETRFREGRSAAHS